MSENQEGPQWLRKKLGKEPTRVKSAKQESRIGNSIGGKVLPNSGARFGENDVRSRFMEIEAKTTQAKQYTLKVTDIKKMCSKCHTDKIPAMVVDFDGNGEELIILRFAEFTDIARKAGIIID